MLMLFLTDRDGVWGNWGSWSTCSLTCGSGSYTRTRTCNNPSQEGNGAPCPGTSSETETCNDITCPCE